MTKDTPKINILTYQFQYSLVNQIYNDFQSVVKKANILIENYKT
jgi:hypothetical protein